MLKLSSDLNECTPLLDGSRVAKKAYIAEKLRAVGVPATALQL